MATIHQNLDHKHILVSAALRCPPTDPLFVEHWMIDLVEAIDMKILIPPRVVYCDTPGNEGITGIVCIETSHCTIHVWNEVDVPFVKFDLYSCKQFDPQTIIDKLRLFDPYFISYTLVDRNKSIDIISTNDIQVIPIITLMSDEDRQLYTEGCALPPNSRTRQHKAAIATYQALAAKYSIGKRNATRSINDLYLTTLAAIKRKCVKNALQFDLTPEWFQQALDYAKTKWPQIVPDDGTNRHFWRATVDRINPELGYVQTNCRIVPEALSVAKSKWNEQQMFDLYSILKQEYS